MQNKYSPSLNTFFLAEFMPRYEGAGTLPDDAISVTDDIYAEFSGDPPEGYVRTAGSDGFPIWAKVPPLTHAEQVIVAEQYRQSLLLDVDAVTSDWRIALMLGDISDADKASLSEWMAYKKEVKAVDVSGAPDISWPESPAN